MESKSILAMAHLPFLLCLKANETELLPDAGAPAGQLYRKSIWQLSGKVNATRGSSEANPSRFVEPVVARALAQQTRNAGGNYFAFGFTAGSIVCPASGLRTWMVAMSSAYTFCQPSTWSSSFVAALRVRHRDAAILSTSRGV
jgi:hypothetical protein